MAHKEADSTFKILSFLQMATKRNAVRFLSVRHLSSSKCLNDFLCSFECLNDFFALSIADKLN